MHSMDFCSIMVISLEWFTRCQSMCLAWLSYPYNNRSSVKMDWVKVADELTQS